MNTNIYRKLKRYKKLLDSNDLLTNEFRVIFEKEYETLLRKYLNNSVSNNTSILSTNTESTYHARCRRLKRQNSSQNVKSTYYVGAEYEFPIFNDSTYQAEPEPSPAERAEYEFD